jgi:myosin-6
MDTQLVWAPDPVDGYALGRVVDLGGGTLVKVALEPVKGAPKNRPTQVECSIDQVYPAENDLTRAYDDNCSLMYLNEGNLLHNIRLRYFANKIYVSCCCSIWIIWIL